MDKAGHQRNTPHKTTTGAGTNKQGKPPTRVPAGHRQSQDNVGQKGSLCPDNAVLACDPHFQERKSASSDGLNFKPLREIAFLVAEHRSSSEIACHAPETQKDQ